MTDYHTTTTLMKYHLLYLMFLLMFSCSLKDDQTTQGKIDGHLLEATRIIQNNIIFFRNEDIKIPRVFYTSSLAILNTQNELKESSELLSLLQRHNINKIYISSPKEIWYVVKEEKKMFKTREYLIGFTDLTGIEKAKIKYYKINNIKQLDENWFSIVLEQSLMD